LEHDEQRGLEGALAELERISRQLRGTVPVVVVLRSGALDPDGVAEPEVGAARLLVALEEIDLLHHLQRRRLPHQALELDDVAQQALPASRVGALWQQLADALEQRTTTPGAHLPGRHLSREEGLV